MGRHVHITGSASLQILYVLILQFVIRGTHNTGQQVVLLRPPYVSALDNSHSNIKYVDIIYIKCS